ncbi:MAG: NAD(P)-dependent dehydrogenase (short-subunit alcohol dehydrogenase family) [Verrucomicrobiales bacterium]|jgi:NAD(P)-dependent dehydrogenase (short-subunit alcohol dehydrogenase family)
MAGWSAADIPSQIGRNIIVTGATSGIGLQTVRELARRGARVILAARNEVKAASVLAGLWKEMPEARLEVHHLDVSNLASVRSFAGWYLERDEPLHVLINNAGIMMVPYGRTTDGNELQFGTNHLGHFALTGLLLPALDRATAARVVTVSSLAHKEADIDFENLQYDGGKAYTPMRAYRRSKLANLLFANELDRRLHGCGSDVVSVAVHPGVSNTNLGHENDRQLLWKLLRPAVSLLLQGSDAGALPSLRAATDPSVERGRYYGPARFWETTGAPELADSTELARDAAIGAQLWDVSAEITGVDYL